jgi:hypothetical protein
MDTTCSTMAFITVHHLILALNVNSISISVDSTGTVATCTYLFYIHCLTKCATCSDMALLVHVQHLHLMSPECFRSWLEDHFTYFRVAHFILHISECLDL